MHRVCFIDGDREFEIPLFQEVFSSVYDVIAADSYDTAQQTIEETRQMTVAEKPRIVERFNAVISGTHQERTRQIKRNAAAVRQFVRSMLGENA